MIVHSQGAATIFKIRTGRFPLRLSFSVTVLQYELPQIGAGVANPFDLAIKVDGKLLSEGYIALQSESYPVEFRIRITSLILWSGMRRLLRLASKQKLLRVGETSLGVELWSAGDRWVSRLMRWCAVRTTIERSAQKVNPAVV